MADDPSAQLRAFLERKQRELQDKLLDATAVALQSAIVETLSQPGSGRYYGAHRASAPGEPPAVDTGRLRGSITIESVPDGRLVGTNAASAAPLEFGTPTIAPRPFMEPAARLVQEQAPELVRQVTITTPDR